MQLQVGAAQEVKRAALLLALLSCSAPPPPPPPPPPSPAELKAEVESILTTLEKSFYSHWGSVESTAEYRKIRDEHVPLLREIADANGEYALMAMRVLLRRAPRERFSPGARAILYWTVFQREVYYNRWGLITKSGFVPAVYGDEMMLTGEAVQPYLQRSLRDTRPAPVIGVVEQRESRARGDRVCDYAWLFLSTIVNRPVDYQTDPRLRDPQIHELDLWLDRKRK